MSRNPEVSASGECIEGIVNRRIGADAEDDASTVQATVGDLNPNVILVFVNACDVQQPFMETNPDASLIQRAEPSIHDIRSATVPVARPLSRHTSPLFHKECQLWRGSADDI
jgi:hypothetical protein